MSETGFIRITDFEMEDPLTLQMLAEATGARRTLITRLVRLGLLETVGEGMDEPLVPQRAIVRLRRMQRLRRDLGVNFAGASVILDLVERMNQMKRELEEVRRRVND
jgi:chaperone modulatory protein CbpM